ncbi:MAG: ABC transporter substrate-binding protein [Firmicutes bacterium]|nr:ABC transporter substrate-binding protein [Bacillota bacterium]
MRITRRTFLRYTGAGLGALAAGDRLAGALPAQDAAIPVGAVYPLSGALARIGAGIRNGIELAVDIVNTAYPDLALPLAPTAGLPRLGGRKIRLVWGDSRGDPATGRAEAERLIERERVVALIGSYQSAVTATASLAAETRGIPFLNPESSSPRLTERGFKWFFRTGPHDTTFTKLFFDLMEDMKKRGHRISRVAILAEDTEFGATAAGVADGFAKVYKYDVVARELYTSPPASLTAEFLRLRQANPDVIIGANYLVDAVLIVRTLKEMRWTPQAFMAHAGFTTVPDFLQATGRDGWYFMARAPWALGIAARKPLVARVNDLYRRKYNADMDEVVARAFTGMLTLADALNRAGSTAPAAIQAALRETKIPGAQLIMPWQGIEFDQHGQNKHAAGIMTQILDGQYKVVWPFEIAEAPIVWPMPAWDRR